MTRPVRRIGLYVNRLPGFDKSGFNRPELLACVKTADACGYDSFWMPEAWERDAFTTLTELAAQTRQIHLATGIVNVFSRTPALLAMSAATLDEISGGRLRLGLGTSGAHVVADFHGLPFRKPLTRLKETIQIIRLLLAGERADFNGECFQLQRFKLGFKPLRSNLPIYVAALTPKSLQLIGELADGWLPTHWPRTALHQGIAPIRAAAAHANRNANDIDIAPFVNTVVGDDVTQAKKIARLPLAYYIGGMGDFYRDSISRLGFAEEACKIHSLWQAGRHKAAMQAVSDALIDAVAICGTLTDCRRRLDELPTYGATLTLVPIPQHGTVAEKCRVIEALAQS
ncbi:MAG: LLM class flavin-dependent oxidoreductase [Acidobacteria bacterium]|nr:LLM class flavin-dependent oxidoreductase [Acidobacteriota bacterium]